MTITYRKDDPYYRDSSGAYIYALTRSGEAAGRTHAAALAMAERIIRGEIIFIPGSAISEPRVIIRG